MAPSDIHRRKVSALVPPSDTRTTLRRRFGSTIRGEAVRTLGTGGGVGVGSGPPVVVRSMAARSAARVAMDKRKAANQFFR
jgi:hypothetical protein